MANEISRYGKTALITGASSGIGDAFARYLAASGCDLIVVARRADRLQELAEELTQKYSTRVTPIVLDLQNPAAAEQLYTHVKSLNLQVDILINNAGFGVLGEFGGGDLSRNSGMVDLNCRAVVDITARFLPEMKVRKRGAVIVVSSVAGALPVPYFSTYGATKAFDLYFGEALHGECFGSGVAVLTVLPGLTKTEFQASSGSRDYHSPYRTADQVVASAMGALGKKAIVVDGWKNKLIVHGTRFLPRAVVLPISRMVMRSELKLK